MTNDPNINATMNAKQIGMKCGCFFLFLLLLEQPRNQRFFYTRTVNAFYLHLNLLV